MIKSISFFSFLFVVARSFDYEQVKSKVQKKQIEAKQHYQQIADKLNEVEHQLAECKANSQVCAKQAGIIKQLTLQIQEQFLKMQEASRQHKNKLEQLKASHESTINYLSIHLNKNTQQLDISQSEIIRDDQSINSCLEKTSVLLYKINQLKKNNRKLETENAEFRKLIQDIYSTRV